MTGSFLCGTKHGGAAASVYGEELHIQTRGTGNGLGDGVRNVVKFQVEENLGSGVAHALDDIWPCGDKEFLANFEGADGGGYLGSEGQCFVGSGDIERSDDGIAHGGD